MTLKDERGRFRSYTPLEKVAAHAEKVNALHPETWHHRPGHEPVFGTGKEAERAWRDEAFLFSGIAPRSQPIEYDDEGWPLWLVLGAATIVIVLVVAVWVFTH